MQNSPINLIKNGSTMNKTIFALHGFLGVPQDWDWLKLSGFQIIPVDYMNTRGLTPDTPLDKWGENFNLWSQHIGPDRAFTQSKNYGKFKTAISYAARILG